MTVSCSEAWRHRKRKSCDWSDTVLTVPVELTLQERRLVSQLFGVYFAVIDDFDMWWLLCGWMSHVRLNTRSQEQEVL
jgi:hypothetical protein